MLELLPSAVSVILIEAHVFETSVAFKILNTLRGKQQKLFDLEIACSPQMPVVRGVLHQHFVRADWAHPVVNTVAAAGCLAVDMIQRAGMNDRARRPRSPGSSGHAGDQLSWLAGIRTEPAK